MIISANLITNCGGVQTPIILPALTTTPIDSITTTTARGGGNITTSGGSLVTERGICWATTANPTTADSITSNGVGIGIFTSNLSGLNPNTAYYVRAYATNSAGTAYGNELKFTTSLPTPILPVLTTTAVSLITGTSATSGGDITSDGGAVITASGICWATTANPTTTDNIASNGAGIGIFTSNLSGLSPNTTYYIRAYAINSVGTAYGNEVTFISSSLALAVGGSYQGGTIAYILQPGDPGYVAGETHGLIAAPSNQSSQIQWNNGKDTLTNATATAIGAGSANTITIIAVQGPAGSGGTYAALLCDQLVLNGYSDWYLPSIDELNYLYTQRTLIGGFANNYYWSSSESTNTPEALCINFTDGSWIYMSKNATDYVRAVRAF